MILRDSIDPGVLGLAIVYAISLSGVLQLMVWTMRQPRNAALAPPLHLPGMPALAQCLTSR